MFNFDLQRFSSDRIIGSCVTLSLYTSSGTVDLAEIDSFTAKARHDKKTYKPLGQFEDHEQTIYKGYDLTFKGGKIDSSWDSLQADIDTALLAGESAPTYTVKEVTTFYDGTTKTWVYKNVVLHGFEIDAAASGDEIKCSFTGFAPYRTLSS